MSGLRSHRERMMTWVSLRSGVASSGRFIIDQAPQKQAMATSAKTRNLFLTEKSMIRLIIAAPQCALEYGGTPYFFTRIPGRIQSKLFLTLFRAEPGGFAGIFLDVAARLSRVRIHRHAADWIAHRDYIPIRLLFRVLLCAGTNSRRGPHTAFRVDEEVS